MAPALPKKIKTDVKTKLFMATFQATHKESIQAAFERFHRENPHVYVLIAKEAEKYFKKKAKFSVKEIVNFLRWNKYFQTTEQNLFEVEGKPVKFRVGDQYISRYARLLINQYPHFKDFIEQRSLRS